MKFKVLALKINEETTFTKNLKKGVLYQFANDYEFIYKKVDVQPLDQHYKNLIRINPLNSYPSQLYDVVNDGKNTCHINITAIVGKNGSGKSSILELLYLFIYCLSERKRLKRDRERNTRSAAQNKSVSSFFEEENAKINQLLSQTGIEIYYEFGEKFYLIENSKDSISFRSLENGTWKKEKFDVSQFFYTLCVNYSIYGLNSSDRYFWLDSLFHKNDGYKVPLVITPWREKGAIDINNELHLAQTRVMANIIDDSFVSENIIDQKKLEGFEFTISPDRIGHIGPYSLGYVFKHTKEQQGIDLITLFENFIAHYRNEMRFPIASALDFLRKEMENSNTAEILKFRFTSTQEFDKWTIQCLLAKYILTKIVKICMRYPAYNHHITIWHTANNMGEIKLINNEKDLLKQLWQDKTHVTLKLKQAVIAFLHQYLLEHKWEKKRHPENYDLAIYTTELDFREFSAMAKTAFKSSKRKERKVNEYIPTGFFKPTLLLSDKGERFSFSTLSSGEQQIVHSIHSIIYHILNLESLKERPNNYQVVNLILDEIELYYHPEYQRQFINKLLESLKKLKLSGIKGINIIFSSHSPFILSDIPHCNVMKLMDGVPLGFEDQKKTFGANIHEMLTDAFFLDENSNGRFCGKKYSRVSEVAASA